MGLSGGWELHRLVICWFGGFVGVFMVQQSIIWPRSERNVKKNKATVFFHSPRRWRRFRKIGVSFTKSLRVNLLYIKGPLTSAHLAGFLKGKLHVKPSQWAFPKIFPSNSCLPKKHLIRKKKNRTKKWVYTLKLLTLTLKTLKKWKTQKLAPKNVCPTPTQFGLRTSRKKIKAKI